MSHLSHGKRHLVSHTLQRIDALIKSLELQIFRVGIAGLDMQENACVRRSVLRGEFHDYAFMVGFGSVRDVRILMVSRNEPLLPPGTLVTYRVVVERLSRGVLANLKTERIHICKFA
ncbi:MAG: hypothetical protein ABSG74_01020 [Candidatus Bathyarchaeia archaeon]